MAMGKPIADQSEYRPPTQSHMGKMFSGATPNSTAAFILEDTAITCFDKSLSPISVNSHCRADKAFSSVSVVLNDFDESYELQITGDEWNLEELKKWKIWEADFTGNNDPEFNSNYALTIATDRVSFKEFLGTEARCLVKGKGYNRQNQ